MHKQLLLLSSVLLLLSCQSSQLPDKEKELLQKENEVMQKENELLKNSKISSQVIAVKKEQADKELKPSVKKNVDWVGTWSFEEDMVGHTLTIENKYRGMNICKYDATGIQTFYNLECRGVDNGDSFELYYGSTNEGVFYQEERINKEKPILTLKFVNGKILSYWNQLIGGKDGKVCFKKIPELTNFLET